MPDSDTQTGEADSNRSLWLAIRRFFDTDGERSLREQLEDAIDEHSASRSEEDDAAPANGDLSSVELQIDRKSTRLNSSHVEISYAVFCLKKKKKKKKKH